MEDDKPGSGPRPGSKAESGDRDDPSGSRSVTDLIDEIERAAFIRDVVNRRRVGHRNRHLDHRAER